MTGRILLCTLLVAVTWPSRGEAQALPACDATIGNGFGVNGRDHGDERLSTALWPDGTVVFRPGGPGFVTPDGALGMKFGWRRGVRGQLTISGRRLDAPGSPLRSNVPDGYGDIGFQSTALIFPTPGCWEVTGRVGDSSLTFVTRVVRIGAGPTTEGL